MCWTRYILATAVKRICRFAVTSSEKKDLPRQDHGSHDMDADMTDHIITGPCGAGPVGVAGKITSTDPYRRQSIIQDLRVAPSPGPRMIS
jgi:hypothetical protein